jgi:hypothetical protein
MRGQRRFSQAISEGDGISLLAEVTDTEAAGRAEAAGAEGLVARTSLPGLRSASELPILWYGRERPAPEVDALVVAVAGSEDEDGELERIYGDALEDGLDCVVAVHDEDELQLALERLDPEILLLSARDVDDGLEHVLGLLPDVPAGKLAIAELVARGRDEISELERAGVDAVIVLAADVESFMGEA